MAAIIIDRTNKVATQNLQSFVDLDQFGTANLLENLVLFTLSHKEEGFDLVSSIFPAATYLTHSKSQSTLVEGIS